jgi:hypothetical protein
MTFSKLLPVAALSIASSFSVLAYSNPIEVINCNQGALIVNKVSDGMQFDYQFTINSRDIYENFKSAGAIQEGRNGAGFPFVSGLDKKNTYSYEGAHGRYEIRWNLEGEFGGMKLSACGQNYQCGHIADWFFPAGACQVNDE